jgi:flagellin
MTSIKTNASAMTALTALQEVGRRKAVAETAMATGKRVASASDSAAYWSIASSMSAEVGRQKAVLDALGLAKSQVDMAFVGMDQTRAILDEIRVRLVMAHEPAADRVKLQAEIRALAEQAVSIARRTEVSGVNLLSTDVLDLLEGEFDTRKASFLSGLSRTGTGTLALLTTDLDLRATSLLNTTGGGILQGDPRSPWDIGVLRTTWDDGGVMLTNGGNNRIGPGARYSTAFTGPISFTNPGDRIDFTLTVDEDNHAHGLPPPLHPGLTTSVVIDRAVVDAALPGAGGVVSDYQDFVRVLNRALAGTGAVAGIYHDHEGRPIPDLYFVASTERSGLLGSFVRITDFVSTVGETGLRDVVAPGTRASTYTIPFEPFKLYKDVVIDFDFRVQGGLSTSHRIDRPLIDRLLGTSDGRVQTTAQMRLILDELIAHPDITISHDDNSITVASRVEIDRKAGWKSGIGFYDVRVNIEPIPAMDLLAIDVARNPHLASAYLNAVTGMVNKTASGGAALGSIKSRLVATQGVIHSLIQATERGFGQLVDADMEATATRLKALQVQESLALQALSIANAAPTSFLRLFPSR